MASGWVLRKRQVHRCTFNELAELYLPWAQTNHRSHIATKSRVTLLCEAFGDQQLNEITPLIVDSYISQRAAVVKPATVNRDVMVLRHLFVKAMAWGKALENPVAHVKPLRVDNRRLRYLSHDEIPRLLIKSDEVLSPVLITALHTGLRRGELFHLTWQDVDFKLDVIRVLQTKNGERREIPMTNTLRATLEHLPRRPSSDYLFPGKTGQGLVDIRLHRAFQEAGIEGFASMTCVIRSPPTWSWLAWIQ